MKINHPIGVSSYNDGRNKKIEMELLMKLISASKWIITDAIQTFFDLPANKKILFL